MNRLLTVFAAYTRNSIKVSLQQRVGIVFFLFGKLVRFGMLGIFVYYLLLNTKVLAGFDLTETLIFFLTFNLIDGITQMLFREVYRFRTQVVSGDFDTTLVKPIHPFMRILLGGVDILDVVPLVLFVGILAYLIPQAGVTDPARMLSYVGLLLNGVVIATGFHILVLALGILSTEVDHTIMIYRDITRMGTFPVDIYSEPLRTFITFVIPIGLMVTYPVKSLLGLLSPTAVFGGFAFGILFLILCLKIWDYALAKYQSASS
jgi:ABC-2 type transport system permease protein